MTKNNNLYRGTLDFRQQHLPPTIYLLSDVTIFKFPGFANFFSILLTLTQNHTFNAPLPEDPQMNCSFDH